MEQQSFWLTLLGCTSKIKNLKGPKNIDRSLTELAKNVLNRPLLHIIISFKTNPHEFKFKDQNSN